MPTFRYRGRLTGRGGSGDTNYRRNHVPAVAVSAVAALQAAAVGVGVAMQRLVATVTSPVTTALALTPLVSGTASPAVTAGLAQSLVLSGTLGATLNGAVELVRATYDLIATRGAATATSAGANAFTNPTNAQGLANGTVASGAGKALGARTYQLNLAYPAFTGKDDLTITAAELRFYIQQTGTALNNGGMTIGWGSTSKAYAQTNAFPADVNYLTTPLVVPITGVPLTWTELASIVARVNHVTAALNTSTCNVDAVHLVVTATRTDNL